MLYVVSKGRPFPMDSGEVHTYPHHFIDGDDINACAFANLYTMGRRNRYTYSQKVLEDCSVSGRKRESELWKSKNISYSLHHGRANNLNES